MSKAERAEEAKKVDLNDLDDLSMMPKKDRVDQNLMQQIIADHGVDGLQKFMSTSGMVCVKSVEIPCLASLSSHITVRGVQSRHQRSFRRCKKRRKRRWNEIFDYCAGWHLLCVWVASKKQPVFAQCQRRACGELDVCSVHSGRLLYGRWQLDGSEPDMKASHRARGTARYGPDGTGDRTVRTRISTVWSV